MGSLIPGYEYDIFISYRQKDNKGDRWVSEFVDSLKTELESTFKEEISVYFDINPHDGLLETHDVDASLKDKLKCLIFIPIISRTYCDPKSFAWGHELNAFVEQASKDQFGLKIRLPNGNVANRVLPIRIYDLDSTDIKLCESVIGGVVRGIEFIYKSAGVNRPLTPTDNPEKNQYKTFYRDQINKVANAIKENISGLKGEPPELESEPKEVNATIKKPAVQGESFKVNAGSKKRLLLISAVLIVLAVIFVTLILTDVIKFGKSIKAGEIKSLIVLPFSNYSGQDTLDWLISGMHSSLVQDISKIGSLRIPGTTTSQVFKNSNKTIKEITSELKVDAALETAVLCLGKDSICIQTRLIRPRQEEEQLWSADYKIARNQILNWYNGVTKEIAKEIKIELTDRENKLLARSITIDREAYDDYLKGLYYLEDVDKESLMKAVGYLNRAVEKDPAWAPLYTGLTTVWASIAQMGFESPEIAGPKIFENLNKALELDPDNSDSRFLSGEMAFLAEWDWEKSEKELLKALAINPSNAIARVIYAQLLSSLQRPDEALMQANMAINLDPKNPMLQIQYAAALLCVGDCQNALIQAEKVTADDPGHYLANNLILCAAIRCREYNKVIKADRYILPVFNYKEDDIKEFERIFNEQGLIKAYEKVMKHLDKFAESNPISPIDIAIRYMIVNQPNKALEWIEKGFELHDPNMVYITTAFFSFDTLLSNPRFIAICKKMNLPLPKK
jgi:TolB-like protein